MKRGLLTAAVILGSCMMMVTGCGKKKTFEYGTISEGVYRNNFFGFSLTIPDGMSVMPREEMDEMVSELGDAGSELLLFISPTDPTDTDSTFCWNLTVTAEKIDPRQGIKNNTQYAVHALKLLEGWTVITPVVAPAVEHTELAGREFVKIRILSEGLNQDIYARYDDGYALIFVGSYGGENGRTQIDRILSTVTFQ